MLGIARSCPLAKEWQAPSAGRRGASETNPRSVIPVGFLESPCVTGIPVNALDVAKAPADLGRRVGLPVRPRAGHLASRQRLRDAVRPARVLRVIDPAALPVPQVPQAAEIG